MMLNHESSYIDTVSKMEHFVQSFFSRLIPKLEFEGEDREYIFKTMDEINKKTAMVSENAAKGNLSR